MTRAPAAIAILLVGCQARESARAPAPTADSGAAGSIFASVPVRVRATTTTGEDQQYSGVYELRRVNDVPGATPEQLRWSIHGARLDAVK